MARPERSILIIGALILALVAGAIVITLAFGSDEPANFAEGSPERALQEYLAAVKDGDTDRAYDLVSESARRQMSPRSPGSDTDAISKDDFARMVTGSRGQTNSRVRIDRVEQSANDQSATITLTIENFSGSGIDFNRSSWTRTIRMVREDDVWKVDEPFFTAALQSAPSLAFLSEA